MESISTRWRLNKSDILTTYLPVLGLVFLFGLFGVTTRGQIFSTDNLNSLINLVFPLIIIAVGATFYYAHGVMDLSVGPVFGLSAMGAAYLINSGHIVFGIVAAIAVAMLFALINGLVTTKLKLPAFLTSLCLMFIAQGILNFATANKNIRITADLEFFSNPIVKILVTGLVIIISYILIEYTKLGKCNRAIGGNILTARTSGIAVDKYRIEALVFASIFVGIGSIFAMAKSMTVTYSTGGSMQFNVMIAMILGGMPLSGGKNARIISPIIGSVTFAILSIGLILSGVNVQWVQFVRGCLFIIVVYLGIKKSKGPIPK